MLSETLRSRWFSGCVHAGLWLLFLLVMTRIGGQRPDFQEARPDPAAVTAPVPVGKLENLFVPANWSNLAPETGSLNPFITSYFQPPTKPPPPSPTTRRIQLTYQGFYQTGNAPRRAVIRFGDALVDVPVGDTVTPTLFVASVTATNLTLTNSAAQTNLLVLNTKKEIEIPIR